MTQRVAAIDWMRGFVMILMAIDHASIFFNSGRIASDSAFVFGHVPGTALPVDQFYTRWITHICAPTFLFLSGTSLALSAERRLAAGMTPRQLDRHLLIRGLVLLGLEALYLSLASGQGRLMLQVLYAIGMGLILMIPLRRLPTPWLVAVALGWMLGGELLTLWIATPGGAAPWLPSSLLAVPFSSPHLLIVYPALPWLAMMALGWAFGRYLLNLPARPVSQGSAARVCLAGGLAGLGVFAAVRGMNAYGNMALFRDDGSLVQWLHVSKYPPSLAFTSLELGLMGVCLAVLLVIELRMRGQPRRENPVLLFGQTALFFYLAHFPLLLAGTVLLGVWNGGTFEKGGLLETYLAAALVLVPLYPLCRWYRRYKAANPNGWPQYI